MALFLHFPPVHFHSAETCRGPLTGPSFFETWIFGGLYPMLCLSSAISLMLMYVMAEHAGEWGCCVIRSDHRQWWSVGLENGQISSSFIKYCNQKFSADVNCPSLSSLQFDFCSEDSSWDSGWANTKYLSSSGCTPKEQHFTLCIFLEDMQCGTQLLAAFFDDIDEDTSQLRPAPPHPSRMRIAPRPGDTILYAYKISLSDPTLTLTVSCSV